MYLRFLSEQNMVLLACLLVGFFLRFLYPIIDSWHEFEIIIFAQFVGRPKAQLIDLYPTVAMRKTRTQKIFFVLVVQTGPLVMLYH